MDEECLYLMLFYTVKAHKFHGTNVIYYWAEDGSAVEAERETWKRKAAEGKADDRSFHQHYASFLFFSFCAAITSDPIDQAPLPHPSLQIKDFLGNKNFI